MELQEHLEALALKIVANKNEPNKRLYCDYLCYQAATIASWNSETLKTIEDIVGMQSLSLRQRANRFSNDLYKIFVLQDFTEPQISNLSSTQVESTPQKSIISIYNNILENSIEMLLSQKSYQTNDPTNPEININSIMDLMKESNLNLNKISRLKKKCKSYVTDYYFDYKNSSLIADLENIINTCYNSIKSELGLATSKAKSSSENEDYCQNIIQNNLYKFEQLLEDYINSHELSLLNFLEHHGIEEETFIFVVEIIKEYNPTLYQEYRLISLSKTNHLIEIATQMAYFIETGIEEVNGNIRPFDIIDYYQMANLESECLKFECFEKIKHLLDINSYRALARFYEKPKIKKTYKENPYFKPNLKSGKNKIAYNMGTINSPIIYYPTPEEEDNILSFLEKSRIPINKDNYFEVLKRYKKWGLNLDIDTSLQNNKPLQKVLVPKK